jgi:hypothetical protein
MKEARAQRRTSQAGSHPAAVLEKLNNGILQTPLHIAHNLFAEGGIAFPGQSL